MAYNEKISDRIREALVSLPNIEEKYMFGGVCYMVNEKMCIGVVGDEMMCRINPEKESEAMDRDGARPMDFNGRPMKGYVFVSEIGLNKKETLTIGSTYAWITIKWPGQVKRKARRHDPNVHDSDMQFFNANEEITGVNPFDHWTEVELPPLNIATNTNTIMNCMAKTLSKIEAQELLKTLEVRFTRNAARHKGVDWAAMKSRLEAHPDKLWSLSEMERTGGEPDVAAFDKKSGAITFMDCSAESPKGRRSLCYDAQALAERKENKPAHSAVGMAAEMGIELLTETQYRDLQKLGRFDTVTSSWLLTPDPIRKLGGAIFGDFRYDTVFIYHNGAQSYYAARGFRGTVSI